MGGLKIKSPRFGGGESLWGLPQVGVGTVLGIEWRAEGSIAGQKKGRLSPARDSTSTAWTLRASVLIVKPQRGQHPHKGEDQGRDREPERDARGHHHRAGVRVVLWI